MTDHSIQDPTLLAGRYRLGLRLGSGAFGSVYKAAQVVFQQDMRQVALKLFHGGGVTEANVSEKMNEALQIVSLLSQLSDWEVRQHFVTVYDLGVTSETPPRAFVAMELVRGGSLEGRIRDFQHFTLSGTWHYLLQISRAMAYMHSQGFVHSDLKPANVLVFRGRDSDLVKIGDLGLSGKYAGLFASGPAGGTMAYMPLEALGGFPTMPSGDVFSMGVMAYEMLTGNNPYASIGSTVDRQAPDFDQTYRQLQQQAREVPLQLQPQQFAETLAKDSPIDFAALLHVINKMLQTHATERYKSAREVLEDLERIQAGRSPTLGGSTGCPPAAEDPYALLRERVEYLVATRSWADASATAAELVRLNTERADGYLLQSQIYVQQAGMRGDPQREKRRQTLLTQAMRPLQRGLQHCRTTDQRRQLNLAMANLYTELGDDETGEQFRHREG